MTRGASPRITGRVVGGVILMALGLLFLLDNFGVLYAGDVFRYWPLVLIGLGLTRLIAPGRREDYVGVHRSYLVNIDRLRKLELYAKNSHVAILADGTRIPVSREGHARVRALLSGADPARD